ncbi:RagB/SusD family nutrient uptake outer membrane protein [Flavobacterium faecale]|uniref:RagB/SusD family nutrient uptake outer membrane protein n=1 Tax=Flavobacterium faecale TaxID=1355330 RepID=A0A2S1LHV5_9FLAO|nr:RagB/SusD family nutrient uptake outer membrane protein [Flavobacterium faecale]AWG23309.1 RagB/SusD family nutrient uptake outer membrane protein [Flavobacterium faecale]
MYTYNIIKKSITFSALALAGLTVSCSKDYLEIESFGTPVVENFYKTPADAEQALNAAYSPMREIYGKENFWAVMGTDIIQGDIGTDDFIKGGNRLNDNLPLFEKESYALSTTNVAIEQTWETNYKGILYANLILNKVSDITFTDANRKKAILAEAHFLRAYYYFDLVNSFGGVPLIDKLQAPDAYNIPRATEAATYTFIENDLKAAIADLPSRFTYATTYYGHADLGAALGLMMRVSLYQNKMDQVKTYGDQLFAIPYVLQNYATIFQQEGEWSPESIYEINFATNASILGTGITQRISPRSKKGGGFMQATDDLLNEFEANDPRKAATFYKMNEPTAYGTGWYIRKYSWAPYSNYLSPTIGGTNNSANNIRVLRLSDAYLMYAEAIYKTDAPTAVGYINKVRKRARGTAAATVVPDLPLTLNGNPLRDAIYHERRVELAGEGYRYHDLIRTGRIQSVLVPRGFIVGKHEVMPIPYSQVTLSKGVLLQNNY